MPPGRRICGAKVAGSLNATVTGQGVAASNPVSPTEEDAVQRPFLEQERRPLARVRRQVQTYFAHHFEASEVVGHTGAQQLGGPSTRLRKGVRVWVPQSWLASQPRADPGDRSDRRLLGVSRTVWGTLGDRAGGQRRRALRQLGRGWIGPPGSHRGAARAPSLTTWPGQEEPVARALDRSPVALGRGEEPESDSRGLTAADLPAVDVIRGVLACGSPGQKGASRFDAPDWRPYGVVTSRPVRRQA